LDAVEPPDESTGFSLFGDLKWTQCWFGFWFLLVDITVV
jgi:hypothetical protein